ncbi:MAG: polysaccharide deacetylase family protein, partial [Bdellovibrionales bacterium]|nr:polysaccharide deacetylase family protein [Bdellovibrionales bacterium]
MSLLDTVTTLGIFVLVTTVGCSQERNFKNDLRSSLQTMESAKTHLEWETSADHPIQLFHRYESMGLRDREGSELCQRLRNLNDPDLSVFAEAISGRGNRLDLSCRRELEERLGRYAEVLEDAMKKRLQGDVSLRGISDHPADAPVQIRLVDPAVDHVISNADLRPGQFALTFDDGPHRSLTPKLLNTLAQHGVLATFFVVGQSAQQLPGLIRQTHESGHSLGSHSWSHAQLPKLKPDAAVLEIDSAQNLVSKIVGAPISFFRFPYGSWSPWLLSYLS